jgi:hypothetical protein
MWEEEHKKKSKVSRPDEWKIRDVLMGIFGLAAIVALAIAGFKLAKWVKMSFF